jgi:RNA polymerase sigma factor (sigma-70 family)
MASSFAGLVRDAGDSYDSERLSYETQRDPTKPENAETERTMDRADWEAKLEALHPCSFAWAMGCCDRDRDDAEEVLQDVYLKIFEGRARFEGRSTLKTWLFAVIRKTAAAHRRTRWLWERRFIAGDTSHVDDGRESSEHQLIHSERSAVLLRAIARLARKQREVIELVFYHDMTIEEAAQVAGTSLGTSRVHYHRAKKRLHELLDREGAR